MAHIGTLRDFRFSDDADDIRGSNLYGRDDEKLGEIDDIIFDHSTGSIQYLVVDTGGWMSSKQFVVPADRITQRPGHDDDYYIDLNKEQVQRFPEYNENVTQDQNRWRDYEGRYRAEWSETGGVLHKEGSVNIITPEPGEIPAASGSRSESSGIDATPTRLAGKFPDAAADPSKLRMRPAGTAADAEDSKLPGASRGIGGTEGNRNRPDSAMREQQTMDRERLRDRSIVDSTSRSFGGDVSERSPLEESERIVARPGRGDDEIGYGNVERTAVPTGNTRDLPEAYRDTVNSSLDPSNDLNRPYPVQQGRSERWRAFEERLRQHRHEATSSCNVCKVANKDRAA